MTATTFTSRAVRSQPAAPVFGLRKILVPVDFSPASKNACKYAQRFAEKFGARLTLLHILAPAPVLSVAGISVAASGSTFDRPGAEKNLRALAARSRNGTAEKTECVSLPGIPSHEIVEFAKKTGADLIVMATHGYTGWKHFCIGSTAERVVRAAPCPVLVVRQKEYDIV